MHKIVVESMISSDQNTSYCLKKLLTLNSLIYDKYLSFLTNDQLKLLNIGFDNNINSDKFL